MASVAAGAEPLVAPEGAAGFAEAVPADALTANETIRAPMEARVLRVLGEIEFTPLFSVLGAMLGRATRRVRMGRRIERVMLTWLSTVLLR